MGCAFHGGDFLAFLGSLGGDFLAGDLSFFFFFFGGPAVGGESLITTGSSSSFVENWGTFFFLSIHVFLMGILLLLVDAWLVVSSVVSRVSTIITGSAHFFDVLPVVVILLWTLLT